MLALMHKALVYLAYGFLALSGTLHFAIDVVSQYLRHKRAPGPETTLYFGLNTAYALGQILFGVLALVVARRAMPILSSWPAVTLSVVAGVCWLAFSFVYLEYREPRYIMGMFLVLLLAAVLTA
jgi:hypothetical protein